MSDLDEAKRWLAQAAMDLNTAADIAGSHPYASCFFSQQAAEKATKAFSIAEAGDYKVPMISWGLCEPCLLCRI